MTRIDAALDVELQRGFRVVNVAPRVRVVHVTASTSDSQIVLVRIEVALPDRVDVHESRFDLGKRILLDHVPCIDRYWFNTGAMRNRLGEAIAKAIQEAGE